MGDESDQLDASRAHQGCSSAPTHHPSCKNKRKIFREAAPLTYHLLAIFSMSSAWLGKLPGTGHSYPLQYSFLENLTDRGAWWAIVHRLQRVGQDRETNNGPWKKSYDKSRQCIKKKRYHFADKGPYNQSYGFSIAVDVQIGP